MLNLKELRFKGIGRFVEMQTVRFDVLGNLIQLDGQNNNTGGSSGAAKTTVFHALDYLLGVNHIPATILQSRITKDPIWVSGDFDWDGKDITITRSKTKGLELVIPGDNEWTLKMPPEEKLDDILAIPRNVLRPMFHKRQKEGGFFLQLTPAQTYKFLIDCLNLGDIHGKLDKIDKEIDSYTETKEKLTASLESKKSGLKATQDALLALGMPPAREMHSEVVEQLKQRLDRSMKALSDKLIDQEVIESSLLRPELENRSYDRSRMSDAVDKINAIRKSATLLMDNERERQGQINLQIAQLKMKLHEYRFDLSSGKTAKVDAGNVAVEIKKIRDHICPTCDRPNWVTKSAKVKETELLNKLGDLKESMVRSTMAESKIIELNTEVERLEKASAPTIPAGMEQLVKEEKDLEGIISSESTRELEFNTDQHRRNNSKLEEFNTKQKALKDQHKLELKQYEGQVDVDRRAYEAAGLKLLAYEDAKKRYDESWSQLKKYEAEYAVTAETLCDDLKKNEDKLAKALEIKKAIKSFASCSFDGALDQISDTATRIIRNIPNMANATIQLEGLKETQAGKVKEEVNAVISMDGELGVPIKSLSGGERSSIDLAIDLAVVDLIESETGKGINVFILDEPFTGLDTVSIEMALEVLRNSNINKRLIIVDHNPEVKQLVQSRLLVIRDGATSRIEQAA